MDILLKNLFDTYNNILNEQSKISMDEENDEDILSRNEHISLLESSYLTHVEYNPQYSNNYFTPKLEIMPNFISEIEILYNSKPEIRDNLFRVINYIEQDLAFSQAVNSKDPLIITHYFEEIYPSPSIKDVNDILLSLKEHKVDSDYEFVTSSYLNNIFFYIKESLDLDYDVKMKNEKRSRVSYNPRKNTFQIRDNSHFQINEIRRLVIHEIGVHYQRRMNSMKQKDPFLSLPFNKNHRYIEEGLAVYFENYFNLLTEEVYNIYKLRAVISTLTSSLSFSELYQLTRIYHNPETSYDMIYRSKRFLKDTSLPGGSSRDIVYYDGYNKVRDMIKVDKYILPKLLSANITPDEIRYLEYENSNYMNFFDSIIDLTEKFIKNNPYEKYV